MPSLSIPKTDIVNQILSLLCHRGRCMSWPRTSRACLNVSGNRGWHRAPLMSVLVLRDHCLLDKSNFVLDVSSQ